MDVTDIIDLNIGILNSNDLGNSFFCLSKNDPTIGFPFDANKVAGNAYPEAIDDMTGKHLVDVYKGA